MAKGPHCPRGRHYLSLLDPFLLFDAAAAGALSGVFFFGERAMDSFLEDWIILKLEFGLEVDDVGWGVDGVGAATASASDVVAGILGFGTRVAPLEKSVEVEWSGI